ncbi:hypothetical protein JCM11641_003665 [Rhodosporidiobolus odoratus]
MSAAHVPWSRWTREVHELRQRFNGTTIFNTRNGDPHPAVRTRGWGAWERQLDGVITKEQWFRWAEVERQSLVDEIGVLLNGVGRGKQCYENVMQLLIASVNGLIATASPTPRRHVYDEPDGVEMEWRNTFLACLDEPTWLRMALPGQQAVLRELEMMKEVCQEVPFETEKFGVLLLEVLYSTHANTSPRPPLRQRDGQPSLQEVARDLATRSAYPALRQDPSRVTHRKHRSLINAYPQEGSSTAPVALDSELDAEAPVNYDATSPIWADVQAVRHACEAQSYDLEQMWRCGLLLPSEAPTIILWPKLSGVLMAVDAISSSQEPLSPRIRSFQAAVMDLNHAIDSKDEGAQQRAACSSRLRSWLFGWQAWRTQDMHSVTQQLEDDARVLRNGGPLPRFAVTDPLTKALRHAHLYMEKNGPLARALEALRKALHGRGDPNLAESYITYVTKQVADWFEWSEEDVVNVIKEINRAAKEVEKGGTIPNLHSLAAGTLSFRQAAIYGLAPVTNRF